MQDEQQQYALHCDWEPCNRRLVEFCFVCSVKTKFYCDSICSEPDLKNAESSASDFSVSSSISVATTAPTFRADRNVRGESARQSSGRRPEKR